MILILDKYDVSRTYFRKYNLDFDKLEPTMLRMVEQTDLIIKRDLFDHAEGVYLKLLDGSYKVLKSRKNIGEFVDNVSLSEKKDPNRYFLLMCENSSSKRLYHVRHKHLSIAAFTELVKINYPNFASNQFFINNVIEITKEEYDLQKTDL